MNENIGEIILYQPDNSTRLDVLLREETVWLNRQQIADLFHRDVKTIGKHIHNANAEELKGISTVAKFATVQKEGNRLINREKEYYNAGRQSRITNRLLCSHCATSRRRRVLRWTGV